MFLSSVLVRSKRILNEKTISNIRDLTLINSTTYLTRSKHTTQKKSPLLSSQFHRVHLPKPHLLYYSTDKPRPKKPSECNGQMTTAQKLKKAVTDYGTTVIVFHISISLASLGTCYFLVLNGLDVVEVMKFVGVNEESSTHAMICNAGTFAVAYALHKVFAPVRLTITLTTVPFLVNYLRQKGILKKPIK
ncbi:protein FAM210B, mitochondrial [Aethina tumida]|uniref:protein FAM210B, mitochondrial n=1 Tax=Aethina tumida TaxID=116153 RepID=UPI00096AF53D|nr:protein FAM210B, mitochondrial [Aethina tumida]